MTRIAGGALAAVLIALPAAAQNAPKDFPLDRNHRTISISGFDVQKSGLTLMVARDAAGNRIRGSGSAGCNDWTATFLFRDADQLDVTDVVTTKKFCGKPKMTTEEAFLTTLRTTHRWKLDGNRLILEGEAGRLLLTSAGTDKRK